jgi:dTDP-4-amino-4,6-dideoxygalactose transaminase
VANGTDALILALRALGVGPGDEVILPANTFVATAEAVVHAGAAPVLADIDPATGSLDPEDAAARVTSRTRVLVPVHLFGQPAAMDELLALAAAHGLAVVEDAAQAHGAEHRGRPVGSLGHAACFSFYPSKNLGAYGDGGAVTTGDRALAERVRAYADHGSLPGRPHGVVGYNSRLDSLQAAVLNAKLPHLPMWNRRRAAAAERYRERLRGLDGIRLLDTLPQTMPVYHLYVVRVAGGHRDRLREHLGRSGIQTGIHYPVPVHLLPAFRWLGLGPGSLPRAEAAAGEILSLPMYPTLEPGEIDRVAEAVAGYFREGTA